MSHGCVVTSTISIAAKMSACRNALFRLIPVKLLLLGVLLLGPARLYAANIEISGELPSDLASGRFSLEVTVSNMKDADYLAAANDSLADRLDIFLPEIDQTEELPFALSEVSAALPFYVEQSAEPQFLDEGVDQKKLTYYLDVVESEGGALKDAAATVGPESNIKVAVEFFLNKVSVTQKTEATIIQLNYAIKSAPNLQPNAVQGSHRQLRVSWPVEESVATEGKTASGATTVAPSTVIAVAIAEDHGIINLPARTFSEELSSTDAKTECEVVPTQNDGQSICSCPNATNLYLEPEALKAIPNIEVRTAKATAGELSITGLDNDKTYTVFLQYSPKGLSRSICAAGKPSANLTLLELSGEGAAQAEDFRCFIASAAYGTTTHPDLELLRSFRDKYLLTNKPGAALVELYYEFSPPVARLIEDYPATREPVKLLLKPLVAILGYLDLQPENQNDDTVKTKDGDSNGSGAD